MTKQDVPPLGPVPKKRRRLQQALDVHLAMWNASTTLTPSERRRVQEERARRRHNEQRVIVGFTGTREGMTKPQLATVCSLLGVVGVDEGHHGDCVGGDAQFHGLCMGRVPVVIHPPANARLRAWCKGAFRVEQAKPFLERNKDIVRESTVLIGAPKEMHEPNTIVGSGTWSTIRYGWSRAIPVYVVLPDGELYERRTDGSQSSGVGGAGDSRRRVARSKGH